jgi:hypothetical protein
MIKNRVEYLAIVGDVGRDRWKRILHFGFNTEEREKANCRYQ